MNTDMRFYQSSTKKNTCVIASEQSEMISYSKRKNLSSRMSEAAEAIPCHKKLSTLEIATLTRFARNDK